MIEYILDIGKEQGYCECGSVCNLYQGDCGPWCVNEEHLCWGACEPVCFPPCKLQNPVEKTFIENPCKRESKTVYLCYCVLEPCQNTPCQKMINLLRGKKEDEKCPEGTEYCGVECHYSVEEGEDCDENCDDRYPPPPPVDEQIGIKEALEDLKEFAIEIRSELLKKLVYSRKKMDECSSSLATFGENIIRTLRCQKAYVGAGILKEVCYGKLEGSIRDQVEELMDNWFCCQKVLK